MRRRDLIVSGALALIARQSKAQPADLPLVGVLLIASSPELSGVWKRLVADLRALGHVEGSTVRYAAHASEDPARLAELAVEIVNLAPRVIYANGDEAARAAAAATKSIPIVAMTDDHIGAGLTDNLARPSRNITGLSRIEADLDTKRLQLLHELVPAAALILALRDPQTTWPSRTAELEQAAARAGVKLQIRDIREVGDIDDAVAIGWTEGARAVLVLGSPLLSFAKLDAQIRHAATSHGLPTMVQIPNMVSRGHLAGYGVNQDAAVLRIAYMIDRILKGAEPGTIPVEQPTKFDFVINLRTATALGLTIPPSMLARADDVIE
jgi:putative ABC transport system substrate-binding protein